MEPKKIIVVKIGGSLLGNHDTTLEDLVTLQKEGRHLVVVHGGAKLVSDWLSRLGINTSFIQGLRVTDRQTLEVVTAVLAGVVNKELVAKIKLLGGKAIGLSGVDGGLLEAKIKTPELGYAGEITRVNPEPILIALQAGYIPIIAPVSLRAEGEAIEEVALVNVNGDTAAGEIAAALSADRLIFLTDVIGLYNGSGKLIPYLAVSQVEGLLASGIASGGMIPKIEACLKALTTVPLTRIIDGRVPHALVKEIRGKNMGTTIARNGK